MNQTSENALNEYLIGYANLSGDERTWKTFTAIVIGIVASGQLLCARVAASASLLKSVKDGARRVRRFLRGESTHRSQFTSEHLTEQLRNNTVKQLTEQAATLDDHLWLIIDGSDLRKPYAQAMPDLMKVHSLDGKLVPGYHTMNVIGQSKNYQGILYHHLFSSKQEDFKSEPDEVQEAFKTVSKAISPLKERMPATWIMDRGFDNIDYWQTIIDQGEHLVCRLMHLDRVITWTDQSGAIHTGPLEKAKTDLLALAEVKTILPVKRGGVEKKEEVTARLSSIPIWINFEREEEYKNSRGDIKYRRRKEKKKVWLVMVQILELMWEPWWLLTDHPVEDAESALLVFRMYRQRWSVEDCFKFVKGTIGLEEVQLLDFEAVRTFVALGWVAAGFLYNMGVSLQEETVQLLAKLGGYIPHKERKPGKKIITIGLQRLLDMLVTQAFLKQASEQPGGLPPEIITIINAWS